MTLNPTKPGVSIDINVSYLSSAKQGDTVDIVGTALRAGRKLAFADVAIRRTSDQTLVAVGRHTKSVE